MQKKLSAPASKRAVDEQLSRYRAMRNFHQTAEPSGKTTKTKTKAGTDSMLPFVIQKHAATRLHYDFRLGWNGVLKSWAVTKGPSYYPGDKRLAVQVEDHPIEYGGFEGTIPKGQYGGGTVMVWDQGTWEPQVDVEEGLKNGSLKFILHGKKMHGKWALIRMGGRMAREEKPNWLLIKEHDEFVQAEDAIPITEKLKLSIVTGRDLDQIGRDSDHVWKSNRSDGHANSPARPETRKLKKADFLDGVKGAPRELLPTFISPQLAMQATLPPRGTGWLHELKMDGYRIQARLQGGQRRIVKLLTRKGLDWTSRMKSIAETIEALPVDSALLDGEVVVISEDGTTSFADLQAAFQDGAAKPLSYFVFDILHLNGHNLRTIPLERRKQILAALLAASEPNEALKYSDHLGADAAKIFSKACELGAEGIVSKRASGKYTSGRSDSWLKLKCYREQEMVIGGYTLPSNGIRGVGALLVGYYRGGKLIYGGRTGTGFTQETHRMMRDRLEKVVRKTSPFVQVPRELSRGVHWVDPEFVAAISFSNWTKDNLMRQATFKGLREDKPAKEVTREETIVESSDENSTDKKPSSNKDKSHRMNRSKPKLETSAGASGRTSSKEGELSLRLTHPDKILDIESGLTKRGLAEYYFAVSTRMLPHIADRPLSLVRCPEGSTKPCFFQKHANHLLPDDIESVDVPDLKTGKTEPYITLSTATALAGLAQMGVLEVHPWGSCNNSLEKPDRIIFDLDPDSAISWKTLGDSALEFRGRLSAIGLKSYLKTTGGKGLHVVIPIRAKHAWPEVKQFAHEFVEAMERDNPDLYVTKMTKSARTGKIYLDYLRNDRGATAVAPYSPRARTGVPVSLPLNWRELTLAEHPRFSASNLSQWKKRLARDPWEKWDTQQTLSLADTKNSKAQR